MSNNPGRFAWRCRMTGTHWEKPNIGAVEWEGSSNNNIVARPAEGGTVMIDPNAPPEHRFANLGERLSTSPDGRHWTTHPVPVVDEDLLDSQIGNVLGRRKGPLCTPCTLQQSFGAPPARGSLSYDAIPG